MTGRSNNSTTTSGGPWKPSEPYLKNVMKRAGNLIKDGSGYNNPKFAGYVPMSAQTKGALGDISAIANQGNPLAGQSMGALQSILGGATNDKYGDLYNNSSNQAFQGVVDTQAGRLTDDVNRSFSDMGRYGSASHTGALVDQVGDYRAKMASDNWNQNIANQRGILGDQTGAQLGAVGQAKNAYDLQYAPAEWKAKVGAAYDDLETRKLQDKLNRFNTQDMAGWNRLNAFSGAVGGPSRSGSTNTATVQSPKNYFGSALGGAMSGYQLTNSGLGAAGGGILGLLSQFL